MIEIRSMLTGWHVVDENRALEFVNRLINSITTLSADDAINYINKNRLRGITVEELRDRKSTE